MIQQRRPMFPLGSVLFPGMPVPLHIFEPRYRQMFTELLAEDAPFGVVLIERGHEVGGGEVRSMVGSLATVAEHESFPDGRLGVLAVGSHRVRVASWLPDDPYPCAVIEDWPDPPPGEDCADLIATAADLTDHAIAAVQALQRSGSARETSSTSVMDWRSGLANDCSLASYQLASLAPVGPFDRQRLLAAPTIDGRLTLLSALLNDVIDLARMQSRGDASG